MKVLYISGPFSHPDPVHGIPVSKAQHTRAWLMKHRLRAKSLDVVAEKALDALAEKEGWDDLKEVDGNE